MGKLLRKVSDLEINTLHVAGVAHEGQSLVFVFEPGGRLAGVPPRLDDREGDLAVHGLALLGHPDLAHAPRRWASPFTGPPLLYAPSGANSSGGKGKNWIVTDLGEVQARLARLAA
jgi:hypothetical protein